MPDKNLKLVAGFVGLVAAHTLMTLPLRKKKNSLTRDLTTMVQLNLFLMSQNGYLAHKLDENDIVPDEFDLIALHSNLM
jgi:hypothetical protein